ncbi:gastrula zinc finger protein XlCGF57.1-like [Cheilinus undulatus]|uniref:gastrula zinc finger protein XlCGF57.1-like n=1 Tax=Cheilinus undulatus TaxID=241271 RepID=UPI001BD3D356|nr:gastrula zinc finger protein XlCGF57.1-like [Cheilinus undulatus]
MFVKMSGFKDLSEVQQLSVCKEEQQERSSSLNQVIMEHPHIKEEPEELWSNQEGDQLQGPEEDDIIKFTFFPNPMKSEDDGENPQSSQFHHTQTTPMETRVEREDNRGPETVEYFDTEIDLEPETEVKTEDSSEAETDDSADWMETRNHQSSLNSTNNIKEKRPKTDIKSHCCSECGKIFTHKGHLTYHFRIHTGEKPFSCPECGKKFRVKGHLTYHLRTHTGEKPFSCSECDKRFTKKCHLTDHMRIHTGEKPFTCSECGKSFHQIGNLTKHMFVHNEKRPYSCTECDKRFTLQQALTKHMQIHLKGKPFLCSECGRGFRHSSQLKTHMRNHTGERPFSCSECGKDFKHRSYLTLHMANHRGEKLLDCNVCGQKFSWHSSLRNHKCTGSKASELTETHTKEKREAKSIAEQKDCGEAEQASTSEPDRHVKLMTDASHEALNSVENIKYKRRYKGKKSYICFECGKTFKQKSHLTAHLRIHTGEKLFSCSYCGKTFNNKSNMTIHIAHHRGEKPFNCNVCGIKFAWPSQLRIHKCAGRQASQPLQNQTEEKRQAETEIDGEDLTPDTGVQSEGFSEHEIEDSDGDWEEIRDHQVVFEL